MKNSISSIWLLGIIIVFILIFACYITVTISYTSSFKMKNEMLHIIEKHKGFTDSVGSSQSSKVGSGSVIGNVGAFQTINLYLLGNAYTAKGECPKSDEGMWYGVKDLVYKESLSSGNFEAAKASEKYYYCVAKFEQKNETYYKVRLFYKFELPVLTEFLSVRVDGMTNGIRRPETDTLTANSDLY